MKHPLSFLKREEAGCEFFDKKPATKITGFNISIYSIYAT